MAGSSHASAPKAKGANTNSCLDVSTLITQAHDAMDAFDNSSQVVIDDAVTTLAWSIYEPESAPRLAELAVETTGLGNIESTITKNQRKTFGTLRDLMRVKSTGIIEELPDKGLVKYAKPVGVVAAITPSTNPSAMPVNKAMMALKGGNAIIIAPSPSAWIATNATVEGMRLALEKVGAPANLVQILPHPVSREATLELMQRSDLVVCTGSQNNVRSSYSSGKPAIGVGAGNVSVIIDTTSNLDNAAAKITASKVFDNATSCSSENSLIILDEVYNEAIAALQRAGGYLASPSERERIIDGLWSNGQLNRTLIARDSDILVDAFALDASARDCKYLMVEETGVGRDYPLSGEKLSLVLTIYRARNFDSAKDIATAILEFQGKGHSIGIHTENMAHAREMTKPVAAFIAGAASPRGKKMGHAGAIVMSNLGSYAGKKAALEDARVIVCPTPRGVPQVLAQALN